jgi:hypothetical protein
MEFITLLVKPIHLNALGHQMSWTCGFVPILKLMANGSATSFTVWALASLTMANITLRFKHMCLNPIGVQQQHKISGHASAHVMQLITMLLQVHLPLDLKDLNQDKVLTVDRKVPPVDHILLQRHLTQRRLLHVNRPRHLPMLLLPMLLPLRHALLLHIPLPLLPTLPVLLTLQDLALDLKDLNLDKAHTVDLLIQLRHLPMPLLPMLLRHALLLHTLPLLLLTLPVLLIHLDHNLDKARTVHLILP